MIKLQEKETAQETFDFVVTKLREQGIGSTMTVGAETICSYGEPGGIRCAIGHLMGDNICSIQGGVRTLLRVGFIEQPSHIDLLIDIQSAHDSAAFLESNAFQLRCANNMITVAQRHSLDAKLAVDWTYKAK